MALAWAPSTLLLNSQFLRLCSIEHNRKNWLFCDTPKGAEASAVVYTLVETAKVNGLDPFRYLNYVLTNIRFCGQNPSNAELEEFLPWNETIQAECKPKLS